MSKPAKVAANTMRALPAGGMVGVDALSAFKSPDHVAGMWDEIGLTSLAFIIGVGANRANTTGGSGEQSRLSRIMRTAGTIVLCAAAGYAIENLAGAVKGASGAALGGTMQRGAERLAHEVETTKTTTTADLKNQQ